MASRREQLAFSLRVNSDRGSQMSLVTPPETTDGEVAAINNLSPPVMQPAPPPPVPPTPLLPKLDLKSPQRSSSSVNELVSPSISSPQQVEQRIIPRPSGE